MYPSKIKVLTAASFWYRLEAADGLCPPRENKTLTLVLRTDWLQAWFNIQKWRRKMYRLSTWHCQITASQKQTQCWWYWKQLAGLRCPLIASNSASDHNGGSWTISDESFTVWRDCRSLSLERKRVKMLNLLSASLKAAHLRNIWIHCSSWFELDRDDNVACWPLLVKSQTTVDGWGSLWARLTSPKPNLTVALNWLTLRLILFPAENWTQQMWTQKWCLCSTLSLRGLIA